MSKEIQQNGEDEPLIDPEVKDELEDNFPEDPFITEYASTGQGEGSEKVDVTSSWIGDDNGENWKAKTKVSAEQIIAMTQVRLMSDTFDELEPLNPLLDNMVKNIEQYAVSHKGLSREQHVSVLKAMHSGEMHDDENKRAALLEAFAMSPGDNDE